MGGGLGALLVVSSVLRFRPEADFCRFCQRPEGVKKYAEEGNNMTEEEGCKVLQETLDRYRAMQNPEFYIKAGWDVWNTEERLRISEE